MHASIMAWTYPIIWRNWTIWGLILNSLNGMILTIFKGWRIAWGFLQSSANDESIDQIDQIDQFEKQIKFLRCVFDNWSHTKYVLLSFFKLIDSRIWNPQGVISSTNLSISYSPIYWPALETLAWKFISSNFCCYQLRGS